MANFKIENSKFQHNQNSITGSRVAIAGSIAVTRLASVEGCCQNKCPLNDPVAYYHSLLQDPNLTSPAVCRQLADEMRSKKLCFGDRLLCPYFRPHLVSRSLYQSLKQAVHSLCSAIDQVSLSALQDESQLRRLGLTELERELVRVDPGYRQIHISTRFDSFCSDQSIQFVEYNAESPAGIAYADGLADLFSELEISKRFAARFPYSIPRPRAKVLQVLLETYRQWGGTTRPAVAIVDWKDVPTRAEQELFMRDFQDQGYQCVLAAPDELEYRQGTLYACGLPVDLVYRRLLVHEFAIRYDSTHPLVRAYAGRSVCVVNSFRSKLAHKKMLFALLTDPEIQRSFSGAQREAIDRHIPWTRKLEDAFTDYCGKKVDLLGFVSAERKKMILKPNDDYGGKGIVIGWECSESQWHSALQTALTKNSANGDNTYVVQEKVQIRKEQFPRWDRDFQMQEVLVDMDPFVFAGEIEGALTRLSETSLCNVTSGGGQVPLFIVENL